MMQSQVPLVMAPAANSSSSGLKLAIIILGGIGMLVWGNSTGFSLGYCFWTVYPQPRIGTLLLVILNALYMLFTSHLIFIITAAGFPSPGHLRDMRKNVSRLTAFTVLGFSINVTAIVWICDIPSNRYDYQAFMAFFGCSFSYWWTLLIVILAGIYETKMSKRFNSPVALPSNPAGIQYMPMANLHPTSTSYINPPQSTMYPQVINVATPPSAPQTAMSHP